MKPDRIEIECDDGSEVVGGADLGHSEDRLVISERQLFPATNDNHLAWPFIPFPEDWYGG
jgi:hypothetical protein